MSLHSGELPIDAVLARRLLETQQPALAGLPLRPVELQGTVNAVFRLGDRFSLRLPRTSAWADSLERESIWLPRLAPELPLRIPSVVFVGEPTPDYPCRWAVYEWLDGSPYHPGVVGDEQQAAAGLAGFISALHGLNPADAPPAGRAALADVDESTRRFLAASPEIDRAAALPAWNTAMRAPAHTGPATWIHGDLLPMNLLPMNLLVHQGRLTSVLDWGTAGVGDPANDLVAAWAVFGPGGRQDFRRRVDPDDGTWERARGIALAQAAAIVPYYRDSHPEFAAVGRRTIAEVIRDAG